MPLVPVNGIQLSFQDVGTGTPVLMLMGTGTGGRGWHLHQVPALVDAGYRVITVDNRGIPPTDVCADGFTVADMVGDVLGLLAHLGLGSCHLVGTSMGAYLAQELMLAHPGVATRAVLIATAGRSDTMRAAMTAAEMSLYDSGATLPARYAAIVRATQQLSPRTLDDEHAVRDWLDLFELYQPGGPGVRAQLEIRPSADRLAAYRAITTPCHVIGFADDLVTPPRFGRELAETIPGATFELIDGCGHLGYLEDPVAVNKSILEFFRGL